jgi:hypothetical protein
MTSTLEAVACQKNPDKWVYCNTFRFYKTLITNLEGHLENKKVKLIEIKIDINFYLLISAVFLVYDYVEIKTFITKIFINI